MMAEIATYLMSCLEADYMITNVILYDTWFKGELKGPAK